MFGEIKLEYNYLSSPEKLIQHQSQYFENNLVKTDITKIKKIIEPVMPLHDDFMSALNSYRATYKALKSIT